MATSTQTIAEQENSLTDLTGMSRDATCQPTTRQVCATPPWILYSPWQRWGLLAILFSVTTSNYFDYYVISIVLEPIKQEFHLSDTMLGLLSGFPFAAVYAVASFPLARWADRGNRRTVITFALTGWSAMTVVCGFASSFLQLIAARLGVALTEPGAAPPAQSLIADYFPPERRAMAIAILSMGGGAAGYCVGVCFGGYIASVDGWRAAFLFAGVPGLALAVICRFFLREPRSTLGFPNVSARAEGAVASFQCLQRKRSYVLALTGLTLFSIFGYGTSVFLPSFMIRVLHATLRDVSVTWGVAVAVAMICGALVGGRLGDWLGSKDCRWYAWIPGISYLIGAPLYWATLSTHHLWSFIAVDFPAELVLAMGTAVAFSTIHSVCGTRRRALAIATVQFSMTLLGCGLGPLISGVLSDALTPTYGIDSLRYALVATVVLLLPAAASFYRAGFAIALERED